MSTAPRRRRSPGNRARITRAHRRHAKLVFDRLLELFGSQVAIANAIGVSESTVTKMKRRIPAERVLDIERACLAEIGIGGCTKARAFIALELRSLTRHDLRPDIYPRDDGYASSPHVQVIMPAGGGGGSGASQSGQAPAAPTMVGPGAIEAQQR